jgi:hypothetical protein
MTGPTAIPVSLWKGSWELVVEACREAGYYALANEITDQCADYLGG